MSMLKLPSGFAYQPSYAGVMLAPRSRGGSSGRVVCGRCAPAATVQLVTMATLAPVTQRFCLVNNYVLRSSILGAHLFYILAARRLDLDRSALLQLFRLTRARSVNLGKMDGRHGRPGKELHHARRVSTTPGGARTPVESG